jgi:transcriptional regulator GlxA family with amidase domain
MDQRVQAVISLMERKLRRDLSLEEMARSVNLSSSRFRHLFKAETGMSTGQYLKRLRMREAKRLLETTFLNMKQIMNRVGVRDRGRFARDFKKVYGLTPTQFRERRLSGPPAPDEHVGEPS